MLDWYNGKLKNIWNGYEVIKSYHVEREILTDYEKCNWEVERTHFSVRNTQNMSRSISGGVGFLIDDVELQEKVGTEEYDIVVANILADVIIPMAPVIPARLKKGGYFITSGIIDFKEDQVKEAIEKAGLTVVEINHQGEWVNITAQKR